MRKVYSEYYVFVIKLAGNYRLRSCKGPCMWEGPVKLVCQSQMSLLEILSNLSARDLVKCLC